MLSVVLSGTEMWAACLNGMGMETELNGEENVSSMFPDLNHIDPIFLRNSSGLRPCELCFLRCSEHF